MIHPIPVICDRCRAEGMAGESPFAEIADILDFDPVPRRPHADGWTPEYQRAFIAALAVTGSARRAARAIGKHAFGAEQLKRARGGRAFAAAWDAALEIAKEREMARLGANLELLAAEQQRLEPAGDPFAARDDADQARANKLLAAVESLGAQYFRVVAAERQARRAGKEEDANFYQRQLTHIEFLLVCGVQAMSVIQLAWRAEMGRRRWPPRPEPAPDEPMRDYLARLRKTAWARVDGEEAWPYGAEVDPLAAEASRDDERRCEAPPLIGEEPGAAGQPAAQADRTDGTDSLRDGPASDKDGKEP